MSDMANDEVLLQREGPIARIVFNRPRRLNAIDLATAEAFDAACAAVQADPAVRVVVLRGEGAHFGAGGDLKQFADAPQQAARALIDPMHRGLLRLVRLPVPVLASLNGHVSGGSLSLALGCDLAIAADDARFNLAYVNVAASCDVGGSWHLPRLVGLRRAMQIALLGGSLDAQEALQAGLVNQVVPAAELATATEALARRLAAGPTAAYGRMKLLLRGAFDNSLPAQLDLERDAFVASAGTADFAEALQSFFTRRPARFTGR